VICKSDAQHSNVLSALAEYRTIPSSTWDASPLVSTHFPISVMGLVRDWLAHLAFSVLRVREVIALLSLVSGTMLQFSMPMIAPMFTFLGNDLLLNLHHYNTTCAYVLSCASCVLPLRECVSSMLCASQI
jgi:hypothetical protein